MVEHSSFDKLVGVTVGNYRLEQLIEQTRQGPIFVARSTPTNTTYLLRILDIPALTPEARIIYMGRFQQEANQVAALQHPAILPLLDYGNYQGMPYLVSPYNPLMKSLHVQLAQHGPTQPFLASRYLDQIAAALDYAHQHAVLHRNLTTRSIFIEPMIQTSSSRSPKLLVADFGVLRMLDMGVEQQGVDLEGNVHTIPVLQMLDMGVEQQGSRQKLSPYIDREAITPEQLLGKPADTSSDIYALGALLYRMLTGHRVFSSKTDDELVQQHLHAPVPSLSVWRKDLPPGLDKIVATAMAKEPTQRFRQSMELADAFHQIVAPQDTARPQLDITPPPMGRQSVETVSVAQSLSSSPRDARVSKRAPQAALSTPTTQTQISRRRVLSLIVVGGGVAAAVTTVALFGRYFLTGSSPSTTATNTTVGGSTATAPATGGSEHTGAVIARTTDVPINSAKTFKLANSSNPGLLIHLSDNRFVAFDSTCTHAGCAVNYNTQDKLLECPCHGASFDPAKNAAVVQGPAQTPLAPVKISVNADGTITTG